MLELHFTLKQLQAKLHERLEPYQTWFQEYCELRREKVLQERDFSQDFYRWCQWPVFWIKFISSESHPHRRRGRGRVEIRELDFEIEVKNKVHTNMAPHDGIHFLPASWIEHKIRKQWVSMSLKEGIHSLWPHYKFKDVCLGTYFGSHTTIWSPSETKFTYDLFQDKPFHKNLLVYTYI